MMHGPICLRQEYLLVSGETVKHIELVDDILMTIFIHCNFLLSAWVTKFKI